VFLEGVGEREREWAVASGGMRGCWGWWFVRMVHLVEQVLTEMRLEKRIGRTLWSGLVGRRPKYRKYFAGRLLRRIVALRNEDSVWIIVDSGFE